MSSRTFLRRAGVILGAVALPPLGASCALLVDADFDEKTVTGGASGGPGAGGGVTLAYPELVLSDGPVAYWRFEQVGVREPVLDEVDAFGIFDGTYVGAPRAEQGTVSDSASALRVELLGDGATMGPRFPFGGAMQSYSVEVWVRPTQNDDSYGMIVGNFGNAWAGWWLGVEHFGSVEFVRYDGVKSFEAQSNTVDSPELVLSNSVLNHVVGVYDALRKEICVWINAHSPPDCALGSLQVEQPDRLLRVAAVDDGQFKGAVDELAIYDKALSETQIAHHYAAGRPR